MKSPEIISKHTNKAIKKSINDIHNAAIGTTPVQTGHLSASITRGISFSNLRGEIGPTTKYGIWVHEGTGIYATGGGGRNTPWRFKGSRGWSWTKGQRPNRYLLRAVTKTTDKIDENFKEGLSDALAQIAKK